MRIVQMLPTLSYGDAIGNHALTLFSALKKAGYRTEIYARNIDKRIRQKAFCYVDKYKDDKDTVILYHLSTGDDLNVRMCGFRARKVIIYHNITPAFFFEDYRTAGYGLCLSGERQMKKLAGSAEFCMADSAFNARELKEAGYGCPIRVMPILISFADYEKKPSEKVLQKYRNDGYTNILFTGRIAPNKKQEDLIEAFFCYHNSINPKSRLLIVGSAGEKDPYYKRLLDYVEKLHLEDVIFTGHIPFDEILAYYHLADVFLCMSEHEGFCVPLVEAMFFGIPIIAYDSTAIGETLGGSGILLKEKDPAFTAEVIHRVVSDEKLRAQMIADEKERLAYFDNERIKKEFLETLEEFLSKEKES